MSKLHSGQKIIKALQRAGFWIVSTKGSHVKLRGLTRGKLQTVIVPRHKEIALGTYNSILEQAGMTAQELQSYIR